MLNTLVNDGRHISNVVMNTTCRKHAADEAEPCYVIFPGAKTGHTLVGVCGSRVKKAGYNGTINPLSLRLRTPGGRSGGSKR